MQFINLFLNSLISSRHILGLNAAGYLLDSSSVWVTGVRVGPSLSEGKGVEKLKSLK